MKAIKNKFILSSIKVLVPNIDKTYYMSITVNETKTFKTTKLDFKKSNSAELNQCFNLDPINFIEKIKFQLYEKNSIFSNSLFKAEVKSIDQVKEESSGKYYLYLYNNNNENCAIVYYNYETSNSLLDSFDQNLRVLESKDQENKNSKTSTLVSFLDLAKGENAETFSKFVHNMEYLKFVQNEFIGIVTWRNFWRTLCLLFIYTICVMHIKLFFIFIPMLVIFFHLYYRNKMQNFSYKNSKHDNLNNLKFITKVMELTNSIVEIYECFIDALQYSDMKIIEEVYFNLLKLIIVNVVVIGLRLYNFKLMLLIPVWGFLVWNLNPLRAFLVFLYAFIKSRFIPQRGVPFMTSKLQQVKVFFLKVIPFAELMYKVYNFKTERNEKLLQSTSKSKKNRNDIMELLEDYQNLEPKLASLSPKTSIAETSRQSNLPISSNDEVIKFEIYENERWWMLVGWTKNLIMNERPVWSDISGKVYMDKSNVFLPNKENYKWDDDWKIELSETTDSEGWEYSTDFNSKFDSHYKSKFVRRRKWIVHAKKI